MGYALGGVCALFHEIEDLVELGGEEVERGEDAAVRSKVVPR
jgi:hypothetical protein